MAQREPHWVKLFLRELERTGNVRISAERAGVDFSTAYQRRRRHAEFAEQWEGALLVNRQAAHVETAGGRTPSPGSLAASPSSPRRGEDAIVRPDGLTSGECFPSIRSGKLVKSSEARWGKRAEERFLTELTVSANVRLAAEAAGFSTTAIYRQRAKSRHFTAAWDAAVETGKARVQAYLVEAATRTFDPGELPIGDEREIPKVSIGEAINIARLNPSAGQGRAGKGCWDEDGGQFVSDEEIAAARENIVNRLLRLREQMDEEEQETGRCRSCGQSLPTLTEEENSA